MTDWYFENLEDTKKVLDKLFAYEETAEAGPLASITFIINHPGKKSHESP